MVISMYDCIERLANFKITTKDLLYTITNQKYIYLHSDDSELCQNRQAHHMLASRTISKGVRVRVMAIIGLWLVRVTCL